MNNAISIEYLSAPCGAGKTYAICEYISKNLDKKFLIVLPTIELGDDYCLKLKAKGVKTIVCNNALTSGSVAKNIEEEITKFNKTDEGGCIIVTQMGWMRVKFIPFKENWSIVIDETFAIDALIKFQIPHTKDTLTDFVSVDSNYDNDFLYKLLHNEKLLKLNIDQNLKLTRELVSDMASYYDAFVEINNWDKLVSNEEITPDSNSSYQYGNQDNVLFILKQTFARTQ